MVLPYSLVPLSPWWFLFVLRSRDHMVHGPLTSLSFVLWLSKDNRQVILITKLGIWIRCIWLKRPYLLDPYPFMVMVLIHFMIDLQECLTHSSLLWFMVFGVGFEIPYLLGVRLSCPNYLIPFPYVLGWVLAYHISLWFMDFLF